MMKLLPEEQYNLSKIYASVSKKRLESMLANTQKMKSDFEKKGNLDKKEKKSLEKYNKLINNLTKALQLKNESIDIKQRLINLKKRRGE